MQSMIIQEGEFPDSRKASMTSSLLMILALFWPCDPGSLLALDGLHLLAQFLVFFLYFDIEKQLLDSLGAHSRAELVAVLLSGFLILALSQDLLVLEVCLALVQYDIRSKIEHSLKDLR